jgi:hypothetical protein
MEPGPALWPLKADVFRETNFVPSTLKQCTVNDEANTEMPHECAEDRLTSTMGSISKTASKDPVKDDDVSSPETGNMKTTAQCFLFQSQITYNEKGREQAYLLQF